MLTVKLNKESGLELAKLFVSTGFYKVWNNFRPPLTPEMQYNGIVECISEETETIFTLHDDGGFDWRTVGNEHYYNGIDNTDNGGPFNAEQTAIIKAFLLSNGTNMKLTGVDALYADATKANR